MIDLTPGDLWKAFIVLTFWICAGSGTLRSQPQLKEDVAPPVPYEDPGACPFEGCIYREWVANEAVAIRRERRADSPLAFTVKKSESVRAVTGVVVTVKPGRVQFQERIDLASSSGVLHIEPDQTLFLLTYLGEGFTKAWFQGKVYEEVDGAMAFFNGRCVSDPDRCPGVTAERPQSVWWVQISNAGGQVGWTDEPGKFDGKDAFGK